MEEKKPGIIEKIGNYIKETQAEAKKVSWPKRKYVITATGIIVVMVIAIALLIMVLDLGLARAVLMLSKGK